MDFKDINQKIILQTGLFGLFMGIFTVLGWSQYSQVFIWLFIGGLTSIYLYKNLTNQILLHCIIIGLSWGFDCSLVQVLFFKTFHINNPYFVNELININSSSPRLVLILIGVITGLISGFSIYFPIYILKKLKN